MTTPNDPDQGNIADTGMFKRFVEHEAEIEEDAPRRAGNARTVLTLSAIGVIIVIAIVVWLLTRG